MRSTAKSLYQDVAMPTILLVGYHTHVFADLITLLDQEGFTVLVSNRDYEAIQLIQQHYPDIVVYDVTRPTMNGKAVHLVLKLRHRTAQIPLLFLANPKEWDLPEVHYLGKPCAAPDVLAMVRRILSRREHSQLDTRRASVSVA
jgi:DNA-binding response OmpR family regulator